MLKQQLTQRKTINMQQRKRELSHVKDVAMQNEITKVLVISVLGWDEEKYSYFVFECGCHFLHHFLNATGLSEYSLISRSAFFWKWWNNQWGEIDGMMYNDQLTPLTWNHYMDVHVHNVYDDDILIESMYQNIQTMIDEVCPVTEKKSNEK